ncbi:MAG: phosphoglycerate kinase [Bacilli bacterium]
MKKTIRDLDLKGKKVIIRCDFNVPIKNGKILDDNRIIQSLETIKYASKNGAKVILMSHLGRVKSIEDLKDKSLEPVADRLCELLEHDVIFVRDTKGIELEQAINNMQNGDILLIENTRYEDIEGKKESNNDSELGEYWANLADLYVNDAFGTCHRSHASNVGIASHLPSAIGFLVEKELKVLNDALEKPQRPFIVILGGSKVSDKIGVIKNLVKKADYILIGGGMAFTFLKAEGINIGSSLIDKDNIDFCKKIMKQNQDKIVLPIDVVTGLTIDDDTKTRTCFINEMKEEEIGLDIGPQTIKLFSQYIGDSETVIWNGPVGVFEVDKFANGTKALCKALAEANNNSIIGGGDTAAAVSKFGYDDDVKYISTGGGASLALLEGQVLPGVDIIDEK